MVTGVQTCALPISFEIYEDPQSEFVADFVGTTNFFDGTVLEAEGETGKVRVGPSLQLWIDGDTPMARGSAVRVSLRPERVEVLKERAAGRNVFPASVVFIEYFGPTIRYTVETAAGERLQAEAHNISRPISIGAPVWIRIDPGHFRLIDRKGR